VSVEDDGAGIPVDQREHVFERGARGSASQSTPGMGLGLYIVRVVAEAHGGLALVDDSDHGTRFVIDLPIVRPDGDEG
jgi:signal transduction histidine kinase